MSRRFVAATETALAQLLGADLRRLDLVAFMVDGVHFGEHTCVVALGIDIDGVKHPLALVEGSTENARAGAQPRGAEHADLARITRLGQPGRIDDFVGLADAEEALTPHRITHGRFPSPSRVDLPHPWPHVRRRPTRFAAG